MLSSLWEEGLTAPPGEIPNDLESKNRSSGDIYFPDLASSFAPTPPERVKVYLYAPDETVSEVKDIYCDAPIAGATMYQGHYQLILDASTVTSENPDFEPHLKPKDAEIDLGELEFVEGTAHDGQIVIDQLDPNGY